VSFPWKTFGAAALGAYVGSRAANPPASRQQGDDGLGCLIVISVLVVFVVVLYAVITPIHYVGNCLGHVVGADFHDCTDTEPGGSHSLDGLSEATDDWGWYVVSAIIVLSLYGLIAYGIWRQYHPRRDEASADFAGVQEPWWRLTSHHGPHRGGRHGRGAE